MSPRSKKEYTEAIFLRYKKAPCSERTIILDEFCATCGYHRKHAIRLLRRFRRFIKPKIRKRGRSPVYPRDLILKPLKQIWLAANLPCSKRLKALLPLWLPGYVRSFGNLPPNVSQALLDISAATIDRLLLPTRIQYKTRGRPTTKPGTLIRKHIPIKTNQWDESRPGNASLSRGFQDPTRDAEKVLSASTLAPSKTRNLYVYNPMLNERRMLPMKLRRYAL